MGINIKSDEGSLAYTLYKTYIVTKEKKYIVLFFALLKFVLKTF